MLHRTCWAAVEVGAQKNPRNQIYKIEWTLTIPQARALDKVEIYDAVQFHRGSMLVSQSMALENRIVQKSSLDISITSNGNVLHI